MISDKRVDIAIVGAGIAGIATAHSLCVDHGKTSVLLIDARQPMSYTSAQSGDNYRNWWPHPTMAAFTSDSIDMMHRLAAETGNIFGMSERGYVLASRRENNEELNHGLQPGIDVDVVQDRHEIRKAYPTLSHDISSVLHVRKGGDINGQQLAHLMLERVREAGGERLNGEVTAIDRGTPFRLQVCQQAEALSIGADIVINAAGPFAHRIAAMLGAELPIKNIYQQKVAFEDRLGAIPRDMPFSIDLDEKTLEWTREEQQMLRSDPELEWLGDTLPGGTHCRPEGAANGKWVKLGWAYNETNSEPQAQLENEPAIDPQFPEIVIRGAAAFLPSLRPYIESPPARFVHYGGYYTMTEENWPLIGPAGPEGAYMVGALSGFGSMSACAAGRLCAAWIEGGQLPEYAQQLSLARYDDATLLEELQRSTNKGLL